MQDDAKVQAYWTPERMKSAHPADELLAHVNFSQGPVEKGGSGVGAPAIPQGQQIGAVPYATVVPHSYYSHFPYSTVGKIFFTDPKTGLDYVCSGDAVSSKNKSVVDTAGHCVIQGGSGNDWFINWEFCPQYYYGSIPHGCWLARKFFSTTGWTSSNSFEDDFGDVAVSPNSHGYIVNVVGGAGWAYGLSTNQTFTALGYPAASPFNGALMYQCGPTLPSKSFSFDDGKAIAIPCTMTEGCSGGPWMISSNGAFGYVNGHNDFRPTSDPGHMYSPYYDSGWFTVFNTAQNA